MTQDELAAIVEGMASVVRQRLAAASLEIDTLRQVLLEQKRALETRTADLELRTATLEGRALVLETQAANLEAHVGAVR